MIPIHQIIWYKANLTTFLRLVLLFIAAFIFPNYPIIATSFLMINVLLDYVDGFLARKYNQCSFFGQAFDWVTDFTSTILMCIWWYGLQPHLISLFLFLIVSEMFVMVIDLISKTTHYSPLINAENWSTWILKYTLEPGKKGYSCKGLGYWNQIIYYLCGLSRILYLKTNNQVWQWCFVLTLIPAISYPLMNIGYGKNIIDTWSQGYNQNNKIQVKFE